jgi:hypothetical protein
MNQTELERLWRRLQPLATDKMPLEVPQPRSSHFGSPLVLSRVHWVRPDRCCAQGRGRWPTERLLDRQRGALADLTPTRGLARVSGWKVASAQAWAPFESRDICALLAYLTCKARK